MLQQSRSETDDLHRTIAVKDAELLAERNVSLPTDSKESCLSDRSFSSAVPKSKNNCSINQISNNI